MNKRMMNFNMGEPRENTRPFVKFYSSFLIKTSQIIICCGPVLCITDLPFSTKQLQR